MLYIVTLLFNLRVEYIMRNAELDEAQLESRFQGEISITSYTHVTPLFFFFLIFICSEFCHTLK